MGGVWQRIWVPAALCLLVAGLLAQPAWARVTADEAARLGKDLTPLGAEQAGNAEGTIPAWDGGLTTPPAGFQPGQHRIDPFPDDQPLFVIDAGNVAQYADRLSPGQVAMIQRYPDSWRLPVYPTRRTAAFPERVYQATLRNATTAELVEGGNGIASAGEGPAFPIPQNGLEAVWNHLTRYRADTIVREYAQIVPTAGGTYTEVRIKEDILLNYAQEGATVESIDNILGYFIQEVTAPARLAGEILLVHETLNQKAQSRQAWVYNPGQRRVRRAPNVAYDNPGTASDGQRTSDDLDMFNGAPDRYDWELVGKRELYVPYNNYRLGASDLRHSDVIQAGHLNPQHLRYELHRVWEVRGTLKDGTSHIYAQRTFFIDEDSWQILVADMYDARGELWRVAEAYAITYYDVPTLLDQAFAVYDLQNGRYLVFGLNNELPAKRFNQDNLSPADFNPNAIRRRGR